MCYRINPEPCPYDSTTSSTTENINTSTTTTPTPTTTTTTEIPPAEIVEHPPCPKDSVLIDGICRKYICPFGGEWHDGKCLQPICPEGTVWRGHRCQEPAYVNTILEIENVFINEANHKPGQVLPAENITNIVIHQPTEMPIISITSTTTKRPSIVRTTTRRTTTTTRQPSMNSTIKYDKGCCKVITPRICKNYGEKWVCFNRHYKRCDMQFCSAPVIYLKVPHIVSEPPMLIMPPNPPLSACMIENCNDSGKRE